MTINTEHDPPPPPPPPPPPGPGFLLLWHAWHYLASTPGSLSYAEREPGTHCLRMRQNSQKSWEFGYYRKISRILLRVYLNVVSYPDPTLSRGKGSGDI